MNADRRLGVLGGTFDPIHLGHLGAAEAVETVFGLDEVRLVPAHDPPHRPIDPRASAFHRFAMAALAVDDWHEWRVSDLEVAREGPSYSIDTLRALHREGWRPLQIFFILGTDAFAEIATWREFPAVVDAANFVVVARPGTSLDAARRAELEGRIHDLRRGPRLRDATAGPHTRIFLFDTHTSDVSSTVIRERIAAGLPIDDLVPPAVARHIVQNELYGAVGDLHGEEQRTDR